MIVLIEGFVLIFLEVNLLKLHIFCFTSRFIPLIIQSLLDFLSFGCIRKVIAPTPMVVF